MAEQASSMRLPLALSPGPSGRRTCMPRTPPAKTLPGRCLPPPLVVTTACRGQGRVWSPGVRGWRHHRQGGAGTWM